MPFSPLIEVLLIGALLLLALFLVGTTHPPERASARRAILRGIAFLIALYGAVGGWISLPPAWLGASYGPSLVLWLIAIAAAITGEALHQRMRSRPPSLAPSTERSINLLTLVALAAAWLGWLSAAGAAR